MTPAEQRRLLERIEQQFHKALRHGTHVHDGGAFSVHIWPTPDVFYRNAALPRLRPRQWAPEIRRMLEVFAREGREPRLEFIEELWPDLAPALEAAGLVLETQARVMVVEGPGEPVRRPLPDGVTVRLLEADAGRMTVQAYLEAAQRAFGLSRGIADPSECRQLEVCLGSGDTLVAVAMVGGAPVAGASLTGAHSDAELAGVWCAEAYRRRGLASAACRLLLDHFCRRGGLVWLSAGDDSASHLYERLGFAAIGSQLNYADPAGAPRPP